MEQVALRDLNEIFDWIAAENPSAAERVLHDIDLTIEGLRQFATGRPGRIEGTFEKVVVGNPYIVVYQLRRYDEQETIVILYVQHTSRDYPR